MQTNLKRALFAVVLIALSSCASLDTEMTKYKGRKIDDVVQKLGYPEDKREILGKTIYKFVSGSKYGNHCDLDVIVDANNVITSAQWNGTNSGCEKMAMRLQ